MLIFTFGGRLGAWRWWQTWTRAQWLIAIGLCPVLLALNLPISPQLEELFRVIGQPD